MAILQATDRQNKGQAQRLMRDTLVTLSGQTFSGVKAMQYFRENYGLHADWHEFSEALDFLARTGQAEITGFTSSRMTLYTIY